MKTDILFKQIPRVVVNKICSEFKEFLEFNDFKVGRVLTNGLAQKFEFWASEESKKGECASLSFQKIEDIVNKRRSRK